MEKDNGELSEISMGKCCICERENETVRTIAMLDLKSSVEGQGWGCFTCDLPASGAVAVLCDECADKAADTSEIKFACAGYPGANVRVPVAELTEEFKHDLSKHPEVRKFRTPPTEKFECVWCREAEEISAKISGDQLNSERYTYPPDEFGGFDNDFGLPICYYCADAAREEWEL